MQNKAKVCDNFENMKKCNLFWIIVVAVMLIQSSCTIEKRHYRSGFHIDWFADKNKDVDQVKQEHIATKTTMPDTLKVISDEASEAFHAHAVAEKPKAISPWEDSKKKATRRDNPSLQLKRFSSLARMKTGIMAQSETPVAPEVAATELNQAASVLGMIGLILAVITLLCAIIAAFVAEGWAALGWIAIMVVFAGLTTLFGLIAQTIFWSHHQGIPWFQWPALIVSLFSIAVLVRILVGR